MEDQNTIKTYLIGLDNLIEDLFGLNAKAFRSIWISFWSPKAYTKAAADSKWLESFTPTVRVWFGLVAFYAALRFFYGSEDGAMTQIYVDALEAGIAENPGSSLAKIDTTSFAQSILKWTFVFFPFVMLPLYGLIALVFRIWPDKPGFVVRFRYIMLTVLPGTALTALLTISYIFLEGVYLTAIMTINLIGIFVLDALTSYRGTLHTLARSNRRGLSLVLAILLFTAFAAGSVIAAIPAVSAAMLELAPKS